MLITFMMLSELEAFKRKCRKYFLPMEASQ